MRETIIENTLKGALQFSDEKIQQIIDTLDKRFDNPWGELSIVFVESETLAEMHGDYCDDPTPTDIITFPMNGEEDMWGELYISPKAAQEYVRENGGDFSTELTRYVIHGYLHLTGYDDIEPDEYDKMKELEAECLALVENADEIFETDSDLL